MPYIFRNKVQFLLTSFEKMVKKQSNHSKNDINTNNSNNS